MRAFCQGRLHQLQITNRKKCFSVDYRHNGILDQCEAAIPAALFPDERMRQRMDGRDFNDAINGIDGNRNRRAAQQQHTTGV